MNKVSRNIILSLLLVLVSNFDVFANEDAWLEEAKTYINNHLTLTENTKQAILRGQIIMGMCPDEAIAAAGRPGPYMIRKSKKWGTKVPPPYVSMAQCENPDNSVIEFLFRNNRQFGPEPQIFHVRFEKGKVVHIDQNLKFTHTE